MSAHLFTCVLRDAQDLMRRLIPSHGHEASSKFCGPDNFSRSTGCLLVEHLLFPLRRCPDCIPKEEDALLASKTF